MPIQLLNLLPVVNRKEAREYFANKKSTYIFKSNVTTLYSFVTQRSHSRQMEMMELHNSTCSRLSLRALLRFMTGVYVCIHVEMWILQLNGLTRQLDAHW
ncbi:unnamed protein product [Calypogeia fissa]